MDKTQGLVHSWALPLSYPFNMHNNEVLNNMTFITRYLCRPKALENLELAKQQWDRKGKVKKKIFLEFSSYKLGEKSKITCLWRQMCILVEETDDTSSLSNSRKSMCLLTRGQKWKGVNAREGKAELWTSQDVGEQNKEQPAHRTVACTSHPQFLF